MKKTFRKSYQRLKKPTHKSLLATDVENNPETGKFICAALYGNVKKKSHGNFKTKRIEEYFDNQGDWAEYLMELRKPGQIIPCELIMFNANYDYPFLMKITNDNKLLRNGGRIIMGELKNGIKILDLTNHTRQGTLGDWINYCDMKRKYGIEKKDLSDLKARVKNDTKATFYLGEFLQNFYIERLGIPLKVTVASAARTLFQEQYFDHYWSRKESQQWLNDYERKAYRGGRVEVFKRGVLKHRSYDVNSMYLSIMRNELLPDPNSARYIREPKNQELPIGKQYITDCSVEVPTQYTGPLPTLNPEDKKLIFPTGSFRAHFASPEINYAIKKCGVKILKVHSIISYESYPYFKNYAENIWNERTKYKAEGNTGMDVLTKTLGNSLYGSFGQQNSKGGFFGKLSDLKFSNIKPKEIGKVTVVEGEEFINLKGDKKEDSSHTFPCIPVMITSYARLMLLKVLKANEDNLIYCDTDSIKTVGAAKGIEIGSRLGEWGYEGEFETEFYKPKFYGDKHKGVPKRAKKIKESEDYVTYEFEKPNTMIDSINRGLTINQWTIHTKTLLKEDNKRTWIDKETSMPLVLNLNIA